MKPLWGHFVETYVSCSYLSSRDSWATSLYSSARSCWFSVYLVLSSICTGFLDFFQVPCASVEHCKAQLSIFAQVDAVGNAWVAGYTDGSLDGQTSAGGYDVFLMKFDAQGVHQWTRQRGGGGSDYAYALQAVRRGATSFSNLFHGGKALDSLARSMFRVRWNGITVCGSILIFVPLKGDTPRASRIGIFLKWIDALSLVSLSPSHRWMRLVHGPVHLQDISWYLKIIQSLVYDIAYLHMRVMH